TVSNVMSRLKSGPAMGTILSGMASDACTTCICCVFRHDRQALTIHAALLGAIRYGKGKTTLKTATTLRLEHSASTPLVNHAMASLSLSMLMPSLGTSIANASLPALTEAFSASFQAVQWVALSYLLSITTVVVGVGRLGDLV